MNTSLFILSEKSSGSSALFRELIKVSEIKSIITSHHAQSETLYWNNAAILLGKNHDPLIYSALPYSKDQARVDIKKILNANLENFDFNVNDEELIYSGWSALNKTYGPIFLEKSPHHLMNWDSLELIAELPDKIGIDVKVIGLVRNPMDTLYSYWKRWKANPEIKQYEWFKNYQNLLRFKEILNEDMIIVRYEDLTSKNEFNRIHQFLDIDSPRKELNIHSKSIQKWTDDKFFGFNLGKSIIDLAESYGYKAENMINRNSIVWNINRILFSRSFKQNLVLKRIKKVLRNNN